MSAITSNPMARPGCRVSRCSAGFTLIELLVVMVIIATLLSLVTPRYFTSIDHAKEVALHSDLRALRDAIDKYASDTGTYPSSLSVLAEQHYVREIPIDPITESNQTWTTLPYPDKSKPGVYDVHSGAPGLARDGTAYSSW